MNSLATVGSLANQKYEVNKNIQRHLQIVHHSAPSLETTRWKEGVPKKPIGSNVAKEQQKLEAINEKNEMLGNRLFSIMNERREARSKAHMPGWRAGLGTTIDFVDNDDLLSCMRVN
jgi:septation ring formation regulator EzrA